ncbi:hypothetical protein G9A89_018595 [Geosiphon pyriformis]|nr:hypothetical protein G9A89_018595 [Geosiphon pyriformis]
MTSNSKNHSSKPEKNVRDEFLARVRYRHAPHPPPSSIKSLAMLPDLESITLYARGANLTHITPMSLLTDNFMGMNLDLSSMKAAFIGDDSELNPLISDHVEVDNRDGIMFMNMNEGAAKSLGSNGVMAQQEPVPWLRRTQYISSEAINVRSNSLPSIESRIGYTISRSGQKSRPTERAVDAVIRGFESANSVHFRKSLKHPKKPNVAPVDFTEIYPNFDSWGIKYALCSFDGDPYDGVELEDDLVSDPVAAQSKVDRLEKAILNPVNVNHEKFLMYYLPTKDDAYRLKEESSLFERDEEELYRYSWIRDYNYENADLNRPTADLVFVFDKLEDLEKQDGEDQRIARFNVVHDKLTLKKKRRQNAQTKTIPEDYGMSRVLKLGYTSHSEEIKSARRESFYKIDVDEGEIDHLLENKNTI